ncbi:MAG: N-acetyl-gamma-glutamyl-phosphate reductase [Leptospiraceae bacterium]|nr:N-acetyl-gamma-glutamyl-phosphate reductase [Leptospiraceae bacterium]MCP5494224.1 N-acetyl-gamma-glutamyl-phosphate reductase [Leptospiraceae bacterium]
MKTVFIDGQSGTTGLEIFDRLKDRKDISLVEIDPNHRKDLDAKTKIINSVDLVILCLPDAAAIETTSLVSNKNVKVLDASTAHRVHKDWIYGMPELNKVQRNQIAKSGRVSNPGCYPTGFLLALNPLVENGIVPNDYPVAVHAISGYSGGGKNLIEKFKQRQKDKPNDPWTYRPYSLGLEHKHLPEMKKYAKLNQSPIFTPSVGDFERGMLVQIPLFTNRLKKKVNKEGIHQIWSEFYANETYVRVMDLETNSYLEDGYLSALACNHTNYVDLFVFGNEERLLLLARLDNLGKGASGAAVQNMNIMLGFFEKEGL